MNARIVLAAVVGGIVLFIWLAVAHMLLGLGSVGFKQLPNEPAVLSAFHANLSEGGLYFYPWISPKATPAQREARVLA